MMMAEVCTQGVDTGFVALGYAKVAVLGVVQGITELLPISSTAHMRIVPALLGWQDPGSAFSAAMQMAALAAVISYFWRDMRELAVGSLKAVARRDFDDWNFRFVIWIGLATIPIGVFGLALSKLLNTCGSPLRTLPVIGVSCIVMAILLAVAERVASHKRSLDHVTLKDAMIVGLAQVGALIPGISKFSFLLGLPAIALAGLKEFHELWKADLDAHGWAILSVGLIVASLSAFVAIWSLMHILERFSSWPFVIYRGLMGVFLLAAFYWGWLA
jgi:undecaprenyl-diphosphatase